MCIVTDGSEKPIPEGAVKLSDNGVSIVWRGGDGYIYKRSIPFLIENEYGMMSRIFDLGITPRVALYDKYTLKIEDLGKSRPITDKRKFKREFRRRLGMLHSHGIRHGDLTKYAIIVIDNAPYFIDFAESRYVLDLRKDKREGGDKYWMERTIDELCGE
jgi:tRNA A-37 threonylcarbamoyl transferase component Bud32